MSNSFDVIVLGVGSMGSSSCYFASKKGLRVLGIEQFAISHELGSHAGQSRIIRKAYFEHANYVPLLNRAYENWINLENETRQKVFHKTGLLYAGNPGHEIIKGVKYAADRYNIKLKNLSLQSVTGMYPSFHFPEDFEILFEPDAGFLTPEKAIRLYTDLARKHGAEIHSNEKVTEWKKEGGGIVVKTHIGEYRCGKLIITAGAWSGKMIPGFDQLVTATRQFVAWIKTKEENSFFPDNFPCWMIADNSKPGCFYGFPQLDPGQFGEPYGLKLAHHYAAQKTDPDRVNREVTGKDFESLQYCLDTYFPGVYESLLSSKICLYGNSPDEHFIIDKLPGCEENVFIAAGFSGHGFKFASVVGEILTELAIEGKTKLPIEFLNAKRFK